jgi:hypothetical protein
MLALRSLAAVECIEILKEFGVDESMTDMVCLPPSLDLMEIGACHSLRQS